MNSYINNDGEKNLSDEFGYLIVQVSAADEGIPIANAQVVVSKLIDSEEHLVQVLYTNENGRTEMIELPAPPKANSLRPGYSGDVYSRYNIRTSKPGFVPVNDINVPIFSGQRSIQPVNMIPLEEGETSVKAENIYEQEPADLR